MCDCFTCKNHDKPELCIAYYRGYIEACEWFLSWAKANKIKMGSIGDGDLGGLYAQIQCNCDETDCLCRELEREIKNNKDDKITMSVSMDKETYDWLTTPTED